MVPSNASMKDGRWCIATRVRRGQALYLLCAPGRIQSCATATAPSRCGSPTTTTATTFRRFNTTRSSRQAPTAYYHHADKIAAPGAKGWNTAVVSCPRARLNGHQNGEADFRIAAPGQPRYLRSRHHRRAGLTPRILSSAERSVLDAQAGVWRLFMDSVAHSSLPSQDVPPCRCEWACPPDPTT